MTFNSTIQSLAVKMPSTHYPNTVPPYSEIPNIPKNWWRFWGIKGRYLIDRAKGETAEKLAVEACSEAISLAGINPTQIDAILCNSTCLSGWSEQESKAFPRFANQIKQRLGCTNALAIDVEQECITFLVSLQIAHNYIKAGIYKNILVCSAEYISGVLDFSDLSSTTFGDGTAAAIVSATSQESDLLSSSYLSNADFYDLALLKWKNPENKSAAELTAQDYWSYFTLKKDAPEEMQKFVPTGVPHVINQALEKASVNSSDIDYYVFHQPSKILVNLWANALGVDDDKFMLTLEHYGCMVSVSMPVTLFEAVKQGKIKAGNTIVIGGAATGWGFGAQVWKLGDIKISMN